jgi:hypothetical protein
MNKHQSVSDLTSGYRKPPRPKLLWVVVIAVTLIAGVLVLWTFGLLNNPFVNTPGDASTSAPVLTGSDGSTPPELGKTADNPTTAPQEDEPGWFSPAILLPSILLVSLLTLLTNVALLVLDLGWFAGSDKASKEGPPDGRSHSSPALSQKDLLTLRTEMEKSFRVAIEEAENRLAQHIERVRREPRMMGQDPQRGMARPPAEFIALPTHAPRPFEDYVRDYCQQSIDQNALIQAAQSRSLMWGSAQPMQGQRRVAVSLGRDDQSRILVFQRADHASEYFVILRGDAFWSFDLMLVFSGKALDGGQLPEGPDTHAMTRKPGIGRLESGNEMTIEQPGLVEVSY